MSATSNRKRVNYSQMLKQMRKRFRVLEEEISVADVRLGYVLAEELEQKIIENYTEFLSDIPKKDPQDRNDTGFYIEHEIGGRYRVHAVGSQVIYDEFGTGQLGLESPHPEKDRYNLNEYNSGDHIRYDRSGRGYWIFKRITYGVPAGAFMYRAISDMADGNYDTTKLQSEFIRIVKESD